MQHFTFVVTLLLAALVASLVAVSLRRFIHKRLANSPATDIQGRSAAQGVLAEPCVPVDAQGACWLQRGVHPVLRPGAVGPPAQGAQRLSRGRLQEVLQLQIQRGAFRFTFDSICSSTYDAACASAEHVTNLWHSVHLMRHRCRHQAPMCPTTRYNNGLSVCKLRYLLGVNTKPMIDAS